MNNYFKTINGFKINPIGIGTWMMGGDVNREGGYTTAVYDNDRKEIEAIRYSISKGQNHIDTAWMYGAGHTEELVGEAIKGLDRKKLFIADKLWKSHMTRKAIVPAVVEMLRKLQTNYLDMLYIHSPNVPEPMKEYISGINEAVDKGLVKHLAVSNFDLKQLSQAVSLSRHPIKAIQNHYNILYKQEVPQELTKYCVKNDILIVAYRPIERKLLADECKNRVVCNIAKKYKKTPSQVALNWLISQENVLAIPKASNKKHIDSNLKSLGFKMEEEDINKLNGIPDEVEH